jgi:hypothetical protein
LNKNHLERRGLQRLQKTIQRYDQEGVLWSFLIPEVEVPLEYDDGDTHYEVERVSNDEQIIRLTYEIATLNHPSVKYRVKNNSIEPMFTFGAVNYFYALFLTVFAVIVIGVFRGIARVIIWGVGKIKAKKGWFCRSVVLAASFFCVLCISTVRMDRIRVSLGEGAAFVREGPRRFDDLPVLDRVAAVPLGVRSVFTAMQSQRRRWRK